MAGTYLLVYYQHPDDHNDAYFPKFVIIFGFVLAGATVLLLPLDVANREGYAGMLFLARSLACLIGLASSEVARVVITVKVTNIKDVQRLVW